MFKNTEADNTLIRYNVGCYFDILNGRFMSGRHGETVLNGGLSTLTGIGGAANSYKSTLMDYFTLKILNNISVSRAEYYDNELTLDLERRVDQFINYPNLKDLDLDTIQDEQQRMTLDTRVHTPGEVWYNGFREHCARQAANTKAYVTLPFYGRRNTPIKVPPISIAAMDSLTEFQVSEVMKKLDKHDIDDSETNPEAFHEMKAKSHMIRTMQVPAIKGSCYAIMTAHVVNEMKLDKYTIEAAKLMFLKGLAKFNRVPKQYNFLLNNVYYLYKLGHAQGKDKKALYPTARFEDYEGNQELQQIDFYDIRGKAAMSGLSLTGIVSQKEGFLPHLTAYHTLREANNWGLIVSGSNYRLSLMPELSFTRTQIRDITYNNMAVQRALQFLIEMYFMQRFPSNNWRELLCPPDVLYNDLKQQGYDWEELLATRSYWVPVELEKDLPPYLSTLDLFRMRAGLYKPYWK